MCIYIVPTESNEGDTALINSRRQKFIFGVNNPTKIQYIDMKEFSTRFFFFSSFANGNIGIDRTGSRFESITISG